ncbi:MAG: NAD-dependent protein deacylase [Clostridiales bacterium]|jgi:NAD-dependent deacetylase|nr:NAD-dependent protein deacylase [Clostridiales bacterium]
MEKSNITKLAEIIRISKNTVFFGGAGVSTESNIPDFRSESGLYSAQEVYGASPEELISRRCYNANPQLFFRYYKENLIYADAPPNAAHKALAQMEAAGRLSAVITQNIDGLHQAAGSKNVMELHGTNSRWYCDGCRKAYDMQYALDDSNCDGFIPKCATCGGIVRPDVVLYGESLDGSVILAATRAISAAQCLIIGGTSLVVYPAAGLIQYFDGGNLVLINKSATPYDGRANLVLNESIGAVLSEVLKLL